MQALVALLGAADGALILEICNGNVEIHASELCFEDGQGGQGGENGKAFPDVWKTPAPATYVRCARANIDRQRETERDIEG